MEVTYEALVSEKYKDQVPSLKEIVKSDRSVAAFFAFVSRYDLRAQALEKIKKQIELKSK